MWNTDVIQTNFAQFSFLGNVSSYLVIIQNEIVLDRINAAMT